MLRADVASGDVAADRRAFMTIVARWRLTQAEVGRLLGIDHRAARGVVPGDLDEAAAERLRLVVAVDAALRGGPRRSSEAEWLRAPSRAFDGTTPLVAMADVANLRALAAICGGVGRWDAA